jgi:hypothetical protein
MPSRTNTALASVWIALSSIFFVLYAYPIFEINTKVRLFLTTGKLEHRAFDQDGLPVSHSPVVGEFRSPFYVVHYGLQYSDHLRTTNPQYRGLHWREDPSHAQWNVPRDVSEEPSFERYFYATANWLVENLDTRFGAAHYVYTFDWPYKGFPSGQLKAPWWSGLTDGYAILLLLRAHEHFGEQRFLTTASRLYNSVILQIEKGGSWSELDGSPWIEEYVDPRFQSNQLSYVFNGMVYATYGIEAYEALTLPSTKFAKSLYESIFMNAIRFDLAGWSSYDLLGNSNNIKYHLIHAALIKDLNNRFPDLATAETRHLEEEWSRSSRLPGLYYLIYGPKTIAYTHFIITFLLVAFLPVFLFKARSLFKHYFMRDHPK